MYQVDLGRLENLALCFTSGLSLSLSEICAFTRRTSLWHTMLCCFLPGSSDVVRCAELFDNSEFEVDW